MHLAHLHPEKIGKVFTIATKFNWTLESAAKETQQLNPDVIGQKIPQFTHVLSQRHQDWKVVLNKTADMMLEIGSAPVLTTDEFQNIEHQVLVATGDRDQTATVEETMEVYRHLKNGRLLIMPDTPHPLERYDIPALARHILKFFNR